MATALPFPSTPGAPQGKPVTPIAVDRLLLDVENPRLELPLNASQETVLVELYRDHRLEELMESFISNGYFDEEPLVAVPHDRRKGYFTVVEGNRRLAALKLLLDNTLSIKLKLGPLPHHSSKDVARLEVVPVKVYAKREDILPYLGFRHITGIKEWDAGSKARYIYQLHRDTKFDLDEIARMIGDTYNMTERLYLGWSLIEQAEAELKISRADFVKFPFSYMYDAVRMPQVKQFLGLDANQYTVDKDHRPALKELLLWLFGSKAQQAEPVVERKEQLKQLAYAVSEKRGTTALRRGLGLEAAYSETIGEHDQLLTWLHQASKDLDRANGVVHRHSKSDEVRALVSTCKDTLVRIEKAIRT